MPRVPLPACVKAGQAACETPGLHFLAGEPIPYYGHGYEVSSTLSGFYDAILLRVPQRHPLQRPVRRLGVLAIPGYCTGAFSPNKLAEKIQ
jgi:hypothetical protein